MKNKAAQQSQPAQNTTGRVANISYVNGKAVNVTQTKAGILVSDDVYMETRRQTVANARRKVCKRCPEVLRRNNTPELNVDDRCKKCGCFILAKTLILGEHCPLNKWVAVSK